MSASMADALNAIYRTTSAQHWLCLCPPSSYQHIQSKVQTKKKQTVSRSCPLFSPPSSLILINLSFAFVIFIIIISSSCCYSISLFPFYSFRKKIFLLVLIQTQRKSRAEKNTRRKSQFAFFCTNQTLSNFSLPFFLLSMFSSSFQCFTSSFSFLTFLLH